MAIIDGRALAQRITDRVRREILASGITPGLAVVLVGSDPASQLYVHLKEKAAQDVGIRFESHVLPASVPEEEVIELVRTLNDRPEIHGVVIQMPLPKPLSETRILDALLPRKDADGFHPDNVRAILAGEPTMEPALVRSVLALLSEAGTDLHGRSVVMVCKIGVFTKIMSFILHGQGATVKIISPRGILSPAAEADILITAAGRPEIIHVDQVKPGATIIDIGINRSRGKKVVGDVAFDEVAPKAAWITPVPGGVGPVTVAMLLQNTYELARPQIAPPAP